MSEQSRSLKGTFRANEPVDRGPWEAHFCYGELFSEPDPVSSGITGVLERKRGGSTQVCVFEYQEDMDEILSRMREELMNLQNILTNYQETERSEEVSVQEPLWK